MKNKFIKYQNKFENKAVLVSRSYGYLISTLLQYDRTNQQIRIQTFKIPNIGISLHVNHDTTYHPICHNVVGCIYGIVR